MYTIKRQKRIQEKLKMGNMIIHLDISVDSIADGFTSRYNDVIRAQKSIKHSAQNGVQDDAYAQYGEAVVLLLCIVFGEDATEKMCLFFENNYAEMLSEVFPFIEHVIMPQIKEDAEQKMKAHRELYKYGKAKNAGLNRRARRAMGI